MSMKIALLPGDGIGPEIVGEATKVLDALRREGLPIETETAPIGGAGYDAAGRPLPEATLALARDADAVLLGAVGGPAYDTLPRPSRPEQGILGIRKALGLFANLRPALLYPELAAASTLKPEVVAGLDLMIVRELTGDIYFGEPARTRPQRRGRRRGLRHDALQRARDPAHRARGIRDGAPPRRPPVLGRQGERARHEHPVARSRRGDGRRIRRRRAHAHVCRQCGDAARAQPEAVRP
jgi:3-isopropylmalate dehydrogenase